MHSLQLRLARPPGNCVIISGGGAGSCALANETGWQVAHIKEGSLETGGESGWASLPVRRGCGPPQDTQAGGGLGEEIGRSVCAGPRNERAASLVGKKASFARLVFLLQRNNRERERERHSSEGDSRSLKGLHNWVLMTKTRKPQEPTSSRGETRNKGNVGPSRRRLLIMDGWMDRWIEIY